MVRTYVLRYAEFPKALGGMSGVLKLDGPEKEAWTEVAQRLSDRMTLDVCRDIVGNTICADFLDYLYRDWYHLGKPLYYDRRLFQYMEVRQPIDPGAGRVRPQFVINVGASERIRHDALTDILELLNARYKLAETVLFHRTKLALTGLLDRCLLEIADLYSQVGLPEGRFIDNAEALLLDASDDGLPLILRQLATGGDDEGRRIVEQAILNERGVIQEETDSSGQVPLIQASVRGKLEVQRDLALRLIDKLRDREVYKLAYKLRMTDFIGAHSPENPRLRKLLGIYKEPKNRLDYLRRMEALCELPAGALIMNCPPDAAMNAKVAKVNLFIEDEVSPFDKYEEQGEPNLTRGALWAQIKRFYELWAASVYVDPRIWDGLSEAERNNLKSVLGEFFFQMDGGKNLSITRAQMPPSLDLLQRRASRTGTADPARETFRTSLFPSGMPFDNPYER